MTHLFSFSLKDIRLGYSQSIYSVTESEEQIMVEILLHQPAIPSFPISVTLEVDSIDAGCEIYSTFL